MSRKVVIAGNTSFQKEFQLWKKYWEDKDYTLIDYPRPIAQEAFLTEYPQVYIDFFRNITKSDVLFVVNEDKNGIKGYIGAEVFAEISFGVNQNLVYNKDIEVIIMQMPDKEVQSYRDIELWLELGWIKLYKK
jgi:hypothetical protein